MQKIDSNVLYGSRVMSILTNLPQPIEMLVHQKAVTHAGRQIMLTCISMQFLIKICHVVQYL